MSKLIETIETFKNKRSSGRISTHDIFEAEKELGIAFSSEYRELLQKYGSLCTKGEEFLGINNNVYDVVKATKEARLSYLNFPDDVYVIENTAIDGILIVQKSTGELYYYQPNCNLQPISDTLVDYLKTL